MKTLFFTLTTILCFCAQFALADGYSYASNYDSNDYSSGTYDSYSVEYYSYPEGSSYTAYDWSDWQLTDNSSAEQSEGGSLQQTTEFVDAERAARAYAMTPWNRYNISFYGYDAVKNSWRDIKAIANDQRQIVYLKVDGEVLLTENEDPLPGIPVPEEGYKYVNVYVDALMDDEPVIHGSEYIELVDENHPITVTLLPPEMSRYIQYPTHLLPEGVEPNDLVILDAEGNHVGYYSTWFGGFRLWIDASASPLFVTITANGGGSYGSFYVDPFKEEIEQFEGTGYDFSLIGGVHRFLLNEDGYAEHSSELDGQSEWRFSETPVQSKSFVFNNTKNDNLRFSFHGYMEECETGIDPKIYAAAFWVYPDGSREEIAKTIVEAEQEFYGDDKEVYSSLSIPSNGPSKSIMIVVKAIKGDAESSFWFDLSRRTGGKG